MIVLEKEYATADSSRATQKFSYIEEGELGHNQPELCTHTAAAGTG